MFLRSIIYSSLMLWGGLWQNHAKKYFFWGFTVGFIWSVCGLLWKFLLSGRVDSILSFSPHSATLSHPLSLVLQFKLQCQPHNFTSMTIWSKLYLFVYLFPYLFIYCLVPYFSATLCLMVGTAALKEVSETSCRREGKEGKCKGRWKLNVKLILQYFFVI